MSSGATSPVHTTCCATPPEAEVSRESFAKIVAGLGRAGSFVSSIELMTTVTASGQTAADFKVALQYNAHHAVRQQLRLVQQCDGLYVCGDRMLA